MTMTSQEREFLRRYVNSIHSTLGGYDRSIIPGVVAALAEIALKEDAIRAAQGMAPEGRGREGGPGSSELPSPVAASDAPKGRSS